MIKRVGHWAFIVVGLAIAAWALAGWLAPSSTCRGVEMGPGDVCSYSSLTNEETGETQTYEQRVAVAQQQAPFGVAAGLGMAAFGAVLLVRDRKAATATAAATSDRR